MALRHVLISALVVLSLTRINRRRAKALARGAAVGFCRGALGWLSRPYRLRTEPCVVFAPHPDDETLGCGGLIARKRHEGLPVHVVFITDGAASHPDHPNFSRTDMSVLRHREALEALAILGVESNAIQFLDEDDGALNHLAPERQARLVERLASLLEQIKPGEIFLPCSPDGSSEHDAAFGFVCTALSQVAVQPDVWQYPVWSWWNPWLLVQRLIFTPGCCVQPTEDFHLIKTRALGCYRSQVEPTPPWTEPALPPELVRICNSDKEFFFRFIPPPRASNPPAPP